MNILICTFSFPSIKNNNHDGRFVFSEALSYAENGANVRVITPHYSGVARIEKIHKNITVLRFRYFFPETYQVLKKPGVPIYNQKSLLALIQRPLLCFFMVLNILRQSVWADIIHAQWTVTALLALPAKWIMGKKVVLTARGSDLSLLPDCLNRIIHSNVDAAIDCFGPQPWNDEYKKKFPAHRVKLPLIVHNDPSDDIPEDMATVIKGKLNSLIVLYIGRFDFSKKDNNKLPLLTLINATKILADKNTDFHIFYIGDGDIRLKKEMTDLANQHNLRDYITFLGVKINVPDYIRFCHLGVGGIAFNGVSQEFTINSKPQLLVDSNDNAGMPWKDGKNAIFIQPENADDLVEKLLWASKYRDQLKIIGDNARRDMKPYIMNSHAGGAIYIKAFQGLIRTS